MEIEFILCLCLDIWVAQVVKTDLIEVYLFEVYLFWNYQNTKTYG